VTCNGRRKAPRALFGDYLGKAEVVIHSLPAVLLFVTSLATIASAGKMLWEGLGHWAIGTQTLLVLDQLHTVRPGLQSQIQSTGFMSGLKP
jgi:hypothetical protein